MIELILSDAWLTARLKALPQLASVEVYADSIPFDAKLPAAVFQPTIFNDVATFADKRILVEADYIVKVIDEATSYTTIVQMANAIDADLQGQSGLVNTSAGNGRIVSCVRVEPIRFVEIDDTAKKRYVHLGGLFRLQVQQV